jgi:hypothetical protein
MKLPSDQLESRAIQAQELVLTAAIHVYSVPVCERRELFKCMSRAVQKRFRNDRSYLEKYSALARSNVDDTDRFSTMPN